MKIVIINKIIYLNDKSNKNIFSYDFSYLISFLMNKIGISYFNKHLKSKIFSIQVLLNPTHHLLTGDMGNRYFDLN